MLTTILITAAVAMPAGFLGGVKIAGSKVIDAERRADGIADALETAVHQRDRYRDEAQELRSQLARLTDRDERGRFVRREQEIADGARPKAGRFKL